jgi:uncharacterized RDD family membrane protein YckC
MFISIPIRNGGNSMYCPICGKKNPPNSKYCQFCGIDFKNPYTSRADIREYAGFWRRVGAYMIDAILFGIVSMIYAAIFGVPESNPNGPNADRVAGSSLSFYFTANWLYYALLEASPQKATVGKMALGIVVTDLNGNRISFGKATARYISKFISTFALIGYIMAGCTPKKQALHDMIAGCLVVTKKSLPHPLDFEGATGTQQDASLLKYRVIIEITPLFLEADYSSPVIKGLNTGEEVQLAGVKRSGELEWLEVICSDGQKGFLSGDTLLLDPNTKWSFGQTTVNLYEQPSLQSLIKKQYHQGEEFYQVTILKNEGKTWLKIRDFSGNEGYIDGDTKIKE